jgi:hypothetical protein
MKDDPAPASKNEHVTGVRLLFEDRLHLSAEPMKAAPHVRGASCEPNPRA